MLTQESGMGMRTLIQEYGMGIITYIHTYTHTYIHTHIQFIIIIIMHTLASPWQVNLILIIMVT